MVREEVIKSPMEVEEFNWQEMARYLALTSDPWQHTAWKVKKFIPTRRYVKGPVPGVTFVGPLGPHEGDELQWVFGSHTPNKTETKWLLAACLGVGVKACFNLHTFRF